MAKPLKSLGLLFALSVFACFASSAIQPAAGQETSKTASNSISTIELSNAERAWLKKHHEIKIGVDGSWPPIDFVDDRGRHLGITAEYLKLIGTRLGIQFTPVPGPTFKEMLAKVMSGELKVGATITPREDRAKKLRFTKPFFYAPKVIVTRNNVSNIDSIQSLYGKKVAVGAGFSIMKDLKKHHPQIILVPAKNAGEALKMVSFGKADAYVGTQPVADWLMQQLLITNLKFVADAEMGDGPQAFGVNKDPEWVPLVTILDKTLASISEEERQTIVNKYLTTLRSAGVASETIEIDGTSANAKIGGVILAIIMVMLIVVLVVKFLGGKDAARLYESRQVKGLGIGLVGLFLCIVVLSAWVAIQASEKEMRKDIGENLNTILQTTHASMRIWVNDKLHDLEPIFSNRSILLISLVEELLALPRNREELLKSQFHSVVGQHFPDELGNLENVGYSIISPDRVIVNQSIKRGIIHR